MSDWRSPQELGLDALAFTKLNHALLGAYAYEWLISLDFEWNIISGRRRLRWPMIFYIVNRYLLLFALIGIVIALDTTTKINCQALYLFNQLAGNAAVGLASINLSIRTMAVWSQNIWIVAFLSTLILGHWSLILQGVLLKAAWVEGVGCVIISTNNTILAATFIFSMCFDFLVLALNAYKLVGRSSRISGLASSRIARMVFEDGLIYFLIAFLANLVATVFMLLNLNQIMSIIFNVPAAVASTTVACRVVRRLTNFQNSTTELYSPGTGSPVFSTNINFRSGPTATQCQVVDADPFGARSGIHIQMKTFTQEGTLENHDSRGKATYPDSYITF